MDAVAGGSTGQPAPGTRCAAHPARPAHDRCPACQRPRCDRDAGLGEHCALCAAPPRGARAFPDRPVVVLAATGVVGTPLAVFGAALGQEYVGARLFSVLFPAIVGLVLAVAAAAVVGTPSTALRRAVAVAVGTYAAVSALLDFRFTDLPFGPAGRWLPPLVAAVVAAVIAAELLVRRPPAPLPAAPVDPADAGQPRKTSSAMPPR